VHSLSQLCCHLPTMYLSTKLYASGSSNPISTSTIGFTVATLANLSANSFPLMPTWLGSQINVTFLLYLLTSLITSNSFSLML